MAAEMVLAAKAIASSLCIGLAALGVALGQGAIASKACENIGLRPENTKAVRGFALMALAFVEMSLLLPFIFGILMFIFL